VNHIVRFEVDTQGKTCEFNSNEYSNFKYHEHGSGNHDLYSADTEETWQLYGVTRNCNCMLFRTELPSVLFYVHFSLMCIFVTTFITTNIQHYVS
jgi:hypothetical protein